ncbi:hypothetical protein GA516_05070 [Lactobacillus pentosus]|uniref:Bacteriocin immunity protein n=2 Tax=Lactiplantibacillus pentosus TaxID=1589 RepID=A0AB37RHM8_LACPE|nr:MULTISPECIES: hypothetical protein [Lactiplantibacillus]EQM52524.1 hypothetical protein N692_09570 [Lactiplantibacillus plantarum EGD-AQ4]MCH4130558.1 hypothetical protein [Lactiplantibacillus sp.]BBM22799.1 hypothetical protein SN13T_2843 [Lactiplantibacillus plantarum]ASG80780.1 hypothetical protein CEW82_13295 [Lactiplantibacillus pentosus]AYG37925.1 hypothetical protein CFK27_08365 [Lactiplantibacillus pentosus]
MAKAKARASQPRERLAAQLALASMTIDVRSNVVLARLVARAQQRLNQSGDPVAVAHQIGVDLGYYLLCHDYDMPRAAYDLLAVAYQISATKTSKATIIAMPRRPQ